MKKIIVLLISVVSMSVHADLGLEVGTRSTSVQSPNVTSSSGSGFILGFSGDVPLDAIFGFRSGLFFTERSFTLGQGAYENKITTNSVDIPLHGTIYIAGSSSYVFVGPTMSFRFADRSETGIYQSSMFQLPMALGVHFKFAPNWAVNVFYENSTSVTTTLPIDSQTSVGATINLTFE